MDLSFALPATSYHIFCAKFVKFCENAKKFNILMVPGSSFAKPGYVRLAFCVKTEVIEKSIIKFVELKEKLK